MERMVARLELFAQQVKTQEMSVFIFIFIFIFFGASPSSLGLLVASHSDH